MKASPDLAEIGLNVRLHRLIVGGGPIPLAQYMALCNAHYYATRDPFGAAGDFTTAPEISQMFGELIGLWAADLVSRARATEAIWVELGPGRGTLSTDALRAMGKAGFTPSVHLVETSPILREMQARAVPGAVHHDGIETLPTDRPLIVIANEFFDALPIRQLVRTTEGWRERMVDVEGDRLVASMGEQRFDSIVPDGHDGDVIETSAAAASIMRNLAARIVAQGGALLAIDYGYEGPVAGDTLQAVHRHRFSDPFAAPGEQDLTAHVNFAALAEAARVEGATIHPLMTQGALLGTLGIAARAGTLARAAPDRRSEIEAAWHRLCAPDQMGSLFKALALTAPEWPMPVGCRGGFA